MLCIFQRAEPSGCLVPASRGSPTGAARQLDVLALPVATNLTLGVLL